MSKQQTVSIVEVGARDGLQNEKEILSTSDKLEFIQLLIESGVKTLETTSFVRADRIPQMGDAERLYKEIKEKWSDKDIDFYCLVPNLKGFEIAKSVGVKNIALFTATSDTFNKKNTNATVLESLDRFNSIFSGLDKTIKVRGYISTVFGCPYDGKVNDQHKDTLYNVIEYYLKNNVSDISLGDTIGVSNPELTEKILSEVKSRFGADKISLHFHDTYGRALANIAKAYELGFHSFDSSAGGLGGCPYAKGATGNVATEDVLDLFHEMGVETGIDVSQFMKATEYIFSKLSKPVPSKAYHALMAKKGSS
ncbi:MAG: hydroxymethylglutaryl-CoA lyase [Bacteriovoracaceae bacterium]